MRRLSFLTTIVFILSIVISASAQQSTPKATAMSFYQYDKTHSQEFNRRNIDARKKWFSAELYGLFQKELKRESEYLKANPTDKPHFGDGLPFRPIDEMCEVNGKSFERTMTFGKVTVKGDVGNVDVHFKYPKACQIPDFLFAINMSKEKGRWVIDDIRYFPGDTSLVEDLDRKEY